jgi:hypothetical protein
MKDYDIEWEDLPRAPDEILTAPPREQEVLPVFSSESLMAVEHTIDDSKELLEASMVRALLRVMNSTTAREADIIRAVGESAELLGKKGKAAVTVVHSENAQINQIMEKPELMDHIKKAAEGIKKVAVASDAGVKVHEGGRGD